MANSYTNGRIVIDTASEQVVATDRTVKISYILFTPDAANDQIIVRESAGGPILFKLSASTAKEDLLLDFTGDPIVARGIYVDTVSANAVAVLYTTTRGGRS